MKRPKVKFVTPMDSYADYLEEQNKALRELIESLFERMDRARHILTEDTSQWKVLDTELDRHVYKLLKGGEDG